MNREPTPSKSRHWLDEPANVKRLWQGFLVVLALTIVAEVVVDTHPHFGIESVFGFYAWFGFLVCAAMVVVAKVLAWVLKRPDTYYGKCDD